jgi:hypothetical protein
MCVQKTKRALLTKRSKGPQNQNAREREDMAKEGTGSIVKRKPQSKGEKPSWRPRVTYTDSVSGKRRDLQRRAESKTHARDLVHSLVNEIDTTDGRSRTKSLRLSLPTIMKGSTESCGIRWSKGSR